MKIQVPLSPWEYDATPVRPEMEVANPNYNLLPTPKNFCGFSPFQTRGNDVGKNQSAKMSAGKRTPLSNLSNAATKLTQPMSLTDCLPAPSQEPESRVELIINIQDFSEDVKVEAETLRGRVAQLEVDVAQAEIQRINAMAPVALAIQVVEEIQPETNYHNEEVLEALKEQMEFLSAAKDELSQELQTLRATNSQLQESLLQERASALQHADIAQDLRAECDSLTAALTAAQEQQQQQVQQSAPAVDNTAELQAQLELAQHTQARLQDKIARLESGAQNRADENAATLEFVSLERQAETEERAEVEVRLQRALKSAADNQALAKRYEEERGAATENVTKAEQEVDLLAEEITVLHRQMNYARHLLATNLAALDHSVPAVGRLARDLAAWCDKVGQSRVGGAVGGSMHSAGGSAGGGGMGSAAPSTATRTPRTLPRSIMRR